MCNIIWALKLTNSPKGPKIKKGKSISAVGLKKPKVFFDFFPNKCTNMKRRTFDWLIMATKF